LASGATAASLARVQLVLAGQHRIDRRARPAHALGQQGRRQCAELLVVGGHPACQPAPGPARQAIDEARQVEARPGARCWES
jgi:hypothetical protein